MTNAPGKTFLKVVGILLIIGGILGAIMGLLVIAGGAVGGAMSIGAVGGDAELLGAVGGDAKLLNEVSGLLIAAGVIAVIASIFNLICGIVGVKNCDKPEKGATCFKFGIAMIIVTALNVIFSLVGSDITVTVIISSLASFLLPVLYLIGAKKNKDAAQTTSVQ